MSGSESGAEPLDQRRGGTPDELRKRVYQHRGKVHLDGEDLDAARADFKRTLFLRQQAGAPEEQLETTLLAIDTVDRRRIAASVAS